MAKATTTKILSDKVQLYRRGDGDTWHCAASIGGKQRRVSTKESSLAAAKQFAEDWYLTQMGKSRAGLLLNEKTFREAAAQFLKEYVVITEGQRSPLWVKSHELRLRLHLLPFFGDMGLSTINGGTAQEYRIHRATEHLNKEVPTNHKPKKAPSRSTMHDEIGTLRMVLKTACRHQWLAHLPDLSAPYKTQGKIERRPWFDPEEYKLLYNATREYARNPKQEKDRWNAEQVHDYTLFMGNTGLRPDEAKNLLHRDVKVVTDPETKELILEIDVRGKRGNGFCKSMPGAVKPYLRLLNRAKPYAKGRKPRSKVAIAAAATATAAPLEYPQPTDPVFPGNHLKLFNGILVRNNLKFDRDGKARTAYSLRHTYICMRLTEGAELYPLAKNCRTSPDMIRKFYAFHIKDLLDASAINVRRPRPRNSNRTGSRDD